MDNKYYIKKPTGYSPCILGNKKYRDKVLNVLPNCVGWATGRFNEMGNVGSCKYLGNTNAENFIDYVKKQNLELGLTPKKGACMVWHGLGDKAGHVAIVEEVISDNEVLTSESGWSATKSYWEQKRKKEKGNWGLDSNYTFLGFIYNPLVPEEKETDWKIGKYKLLVAKTIRTSTSLSSSNIVLVKNCMTSVRNNLTSKSLNDKAVYKVGTIVDITKIVYDGKRIWGKLKNCYIVLRNIDGTPQAKRVD